MTQEPRDTEIGSEHRSVSLLLLLPNMVTLLGMSLGLTAIRFAIEGRFALAVFLILLAALVDGLDGLVARRLGAESPMGAQLDSLSDFLCFGVAPALVVYQMHLSQGSGIGWVTVLLFSAAACLRLARFNVAKGEADREPAPKMYFVGVPAPSGASLALLPVFLTLAGVFEAGSAPFGVMVWLCFVGVLMISRLRTPSPRAIKVPRRLAVLILCATVIVIGLLFTRPWLLLVVLNMLYLGVVLQAVLRRRGSVFF
ncbi:CDP-diacylglycerol--serine O-phosphatidyltransferase [Cognatishimia sp. F0-27]|uniref:CDP-diacylglycerol--serine O-phosphatidyltransferase n=1 Tax=Cognatishimia sp. F0-27 TaxID=2816855 RepID=UPI001D0C353C|nr:CDP-diacylglycerol--serine O-phosphatidyltransferase [Cognatishimia sp. F0-27]MCC1493275.1 CDP-diacylglycerol--serine O-phosphatidyltransferase [Cognatishimia sp. F0-27]